MDNRRSPQASIQEIENAVYHPAALRSAGWATTSLRERMAAEQIPGVSVAVIDRGELAWAKGYGVRERGCPEPVTVDTRFQAASMSKPVASLAALSLVQEGRLSLDEDIRRYQKTWSLPGLGKWQPRVTLRQLLSHASGTGIDTYNGYTQSAPLPSLLQVLDGLPPANSPATIVSAIPGLQFQYSGAAYSILQQLLEDVSGQPFWLAAKERVLDPAGMTSSTYQLLQPDQEALDLAAGHRSDGQPLAGKWHRYPESAAAGLWTTPGDLARLLVAIEQTLSGRGERIISRALLDDMLTPQIKVSGLSLVGWEGLGFFLTQEGEEWYYGHGGDNAGYYGQMIARKGRGQAAVIMTNSDSGSALAEDLMATIALEYGWPGFPWTPPIPVELDPGERSLVCGSYRLDNGWTARVRPSGPDLALEIPGQPALTLLARAPLTFYIREVNGEVAFNMEGERVVSLVIRQNGEKFQGMKES